MVDTAAVLPASVAVAFTGNAAEVSGGNSQVGSQSGSTGGFSDTLGAMVTIGRQCDMNSAIRMNTEDAVIMTGDALSELAELEQSAQELKELLKTAELAGYMQAAVTRFTSDIPPVDNAELMQIVGNADNKEPDVATMVQNVAQSVELTVLTAESPQSPPDNTIVSKNVSENDFADDLNQAVAENNESVKNTLTEPEVKAASVKSNENVKTDVTAEPTSENSITAEVKTETNTEVTADSADDTVKSMNKMNAVKVTSYEKADDSVKQDMQTQDDSTPRIAFTKRNIESKSDELKAIAKGSVVTKSDSDLKTEQKVTDKNAANDTDARGANVFVKTESRFDDNGQEAPTVRVPISDMASFVREYAPKTNCKSTLTVVLTPETLGKITVRMVNESGKLTVEILTETQAAKELLQAKSEQLAYALRNDDVELTSYKVETSQAELFQRDFDGSSKNPYRQQSHGKDRNDTDDFDSMLSEIQAMD